MPKRLPPQPSLTQLKNQAKDLVKAHQSGEPDACTRIRASHPKFSSVSEVRDAEVSLADAQLVIAREYGFTRWSELKRQVDERSGTPHELILRRVAQVVAERVEGAAKVVRRMLDEPEKAAVLTIALGQETTAGMMKYLTEPEIEQIARAISRLDAVTTEREDEILEEFERLMVAGKYVSQGGIEYARGALEKAVGPRKAKALLKRIEAEHEIVAGRVVKLLRELPDEAAKTIRMMQDDAPKVALLVHTLGREAFGKAIDHLSDSEVEQIDRSVAEVEGSTSEQEMEALEVFEQLLMAGKYVSRGGVDYARGALEKAVGPRKAKALLDRVTRSTHSGFLMVRQMDAEQIVPVISKEPPQAVASILSQLEATQAIGVFNGLPESLRAEVASRIGRKASLSPDELRDLDERLGRDLRGVSVDKSG